MTLAYLATVAVALVLLAVALRRHPASTPLPPKAPAPIAGLHAEPEVRLILAAAAQLAARLDTAA
jgi:hypothetical protein